MTAVEHDELIIKVSKVGAYLGQISNHFFCLVHLRQPLNVAGLLLQPFLFPDGFLERSFQL